MWNYISMETKYAFENVANKDLRQYLCSWKSLEAYGNESISQFGKHWAWRLQHSRIMQLGHTSFPGLTKCERPSTSHLKYGRLFSKYGLHDRIGFAISSWTLVKSVYTVFMRHVSLQNVRPVCQEIIVTWTLSRSPAHCKQFCLRPGAFLWRIMKR